MFLSIIIPVCRKENSVIDVLGKLHKLKLPSFVEKKEIIVIDDLPDDESLKKIKNFIPRKIDFSVIAHKTKKGKGEAIRTGIENAKGDVILIQNPDLELDINDIPRMLTAMKDLNADLISGSRFMPGIVRPLHSYRKYLGNKFVSFLVSIFLNIKLTDIACNYKLFKKNLLYNFILHEKGIGLESELMIKSARVKLSKIAELPVSYVPANEGKGKRIKINIAFKILWVVTKYSVLKLN